MILIAANRAMATGFVVGLDQLLRAIF